MSAQLIQRPRRLRKSSKLRNMLENVHLSSSDFIFPVFIIEGRDHKQEIVSLPGQYRWSIDRLPEVLSEILEANICGVMLFGVPENKDSIGSENYQEDGITQKAIRYFKLNAPDLVIFTDVCLCSFTDHGHCGVIEGEEILNDQTLEILAKTAVSHARSGADFVAPSGMMDGMIKEIRFHLDKAGFETVGIMSYAVKYASAFYGPFREACASSLKGNRKTYQMNYCNDSREAKREAKLDEEEGADFLMVKPALSYLDVIKDISSHTNLPVAAYNVSGEYDMVKAAAEKGWIDERSIVIESLTAMKRAGADVILTYHALDACSWLKLN